eukprot:m.942 g.942  ORF g.942 m.942 type:complete len:292 (+) comp362_c0_seq1:130-1005(+)
MRSPRGLMFATRGKLKEMVDFFSAPLKQGRLPTPYVWCNACATIDGRISFGSGTQQHDAPPVRHVGEVLPPGRGSFGSKLDLLSLYTGWTLADAVIGSGEILRAEPRVTWTPNYHEFPMLRHVRCGQSRTHVPVAVVATQSGDLDPKHPMFSRDAPTVVCTNDAGADRLVGVGLPPDVKILRLAPACEPVDFGRMLHELQRTLGLSVFDCAGGGRLLGAFVTQGLINEVRLTLAAQIAGACDAHGEPLPSWLTFAPGTNVHPSPQLHIHRVLPTPTHLFLRASLIQHLEQT